MTTPSEVSITNVYHDSQVTPHCESFVDKKISNRTMIYHLDMSRV